MTIWSAPAAAAAAEQREECLGSAQVSLADFAVETVSVKWYNVLSFHFMQQPRDSPKQVRG